MRRSRLVLATVILIGIAAGLGAWTFVYARGYSYLTDDPASCGNCHVMDEHLAAWRKSSHAAVAVCNDCHTPHGSALEKYRVKAKNGFWHSFYFTTGTFPDPIRITEPNHEVVEGACRSCHESIAEAVDHGASSSGPGESMECTRCHRSVGHRVR